VRRVEQNQHPLETTIGSAYRYSALMDRLFGKDANALIQSYTDLVPGRPTALEHRHPQDDLRTPYDRRRAAR
jgi:hypothetical protein